MDSLKEIFRSFNSLPYLFIGSGISRRYLELEDWKGLLEKFIHKINSDDLAFERYYNDAKISLKKMNVDDESLILPMVASLLESDFDQKWFKDESFSENRKRYINEVKAGISPFRLEIAEYIKSNSNLDGINEIHKREIDLLHDIADKSINGIITTNYDLLIQNLLKDKDYDTYIGQKNLMFSSVNGIREIYKIHGCCDDPSSIMITYEDYIKYRKRNAYIAAKLLTIFVEHPIIFLGYNIGDNNIINILESIVDCLDEDNIDQLKNRLFFVQRSKIEGHINVVDHVQQFGKISIPMKKVEINDFSLLYEAILETKAKYNPRLLKMLKNDIYDLVVTNKANGKLIATTNIDDKDLSKVDVVIGVGLKNLARNGIVGISTIDIFKDIIYDKFDWLTIPEFKSEFINKTLPNELARSSGSLPVFKYINGCDDIPINIENYINKKIDLNSFLSAGLKHDKARNRRYTTIEDVLRNVTELNKQMLQIAILDENQIDLNEFKAFLINTIENKNDILTDKKHSTNYKRLIKIYDFLKYKN